MALAIRPTFCVSRAMNAIELPRDTWRAVIAALRESVMPYMLQHAHVIGEQLERPDPDDATVRLSLTDDVFRRSSAWAHRQLGISMPVG